MKRIIFLCLYLASACAVALGLPTVDYGATTTAIQGIYDFGALLGLPMWVLVGLKIIQMAMTLIKVNFPNVDKKN